jgi:hypothetical protein
LAPGAYSGVRGRLVHEEWRTKVPTSLTVAGARTAQGGVYIDIVVESEQTGSRIAGTDPAWSVAKQISGHIFPPYAAGEASVLRIRDAAGRERAVRKGAFTTTWPWYCGPHFGCILFRRDWVSPLDAEAGSRCVGTLRLSTDEPVALGPATLLPPSAPELDVEGALHRVLGIPPEGLTVEVRATDWMALPPVKEWIPTSEGWKAVR